MGTAVEYKTGPVYFKIMMDLIAASSPKSMRLLLNKLQMISLKSFDGKNVVKCCATIKGAVETLENNNAVPSDMLDIVFDILKWCSTQVFVNTIRTIAINHEQKVKVMTLNVLLSDEEAKFAMSRQDQWDAVAKEPDSSF